MSPLASPLWLAIHLPLLPLEARLLPSPSVIGERHRLVVCDAVASRAGLRPGMRVAAARSLLPTVHVVERDIASEQAAMERLACWVGEFTPSVSLVPAQTSNDCYAMLLDIGPCLRLFGGIEALLSSVREGLREQGVTAQIAAAPIAQAALWLAAEQTTKMSAMVCGTFAETQEQLRRLSLNVLLPKAAQALRNFGMRTLGDVCLLPSSALARRIDAEALALLMRGFGDIPDMRPLFEFPERFSSSLELPAAVESAEMLLFAARRLVAALTGWLAVRQAGIRELTLHLLHRRSTTPVVLRFAESTRDKARIERVLRERLQRLTPPRKTPGRPKFLLASLGGGSGVSSEPGAVLPAPVEWLRLEAARVDALPGQSRALFTSTTGNAAAMGELIERLRARLGEERVFALAGVADHRPECATKQVSTWTAAPTGDQGDHGDKMPLRPCWLLHQPKPLREVNGRPCHEGPLQLLNKPERIASGWWSEKGVGEGGEGIGDVCRDYFVALSPDGSRLWIYRDWKYAGWFLHGFFA